MIKLKRIIKTALCGIGLHLFYPIEDAQFEYTGKYKCKNCGRRQIFLNNEGG
jgi:hypothetical protein